MDKKQLPGFGNVEHLGADGFTVPSCSLPARGDVEYRQSRVVAGKDRQLIRTTIKLFGKIAQADAVGGDIVDCCGCKQTTVGDVDLRVFQRDARMTAFF